MLGGRMNRFYSGDPLGTANVLVDALIAQEPTIRVDKLALPRTNDGLVLEVRDGVIYQFITPAGSLCLSCLPQTGVGEATWGDLIQVLKVGYRCSESVDFEHSTIQHIVLTIDHTGAPLHATPHVQRPLLGR